MEYLSQECYDALVAELNEMINVEVPRVKNAIAEARDKGDLSENFEYHAAKREQAKLFSRIRFKQRVLENARVMDTSHLKDDVVGLFRKVTMTNMKTNSQMGKISIKSPVAEALTGKAVGDVVEVKVPSGILNLRIDAITVV